MKVYIILEQMYQGTSTFPDPFFSRNVPGEQCVEAWIIHGRATYLEKRDAHNVAKQLDANVPGKVKVFSLELEDET